MTNVQEQHPTSRSGGWRDALRKSWLIDGHADRGALLGAEESAGLHMADFPTGRVIFVEGTPVLRAYVVVSGMVKITSCGGLGRPVLRAVLGPGDVLDEAALFGDEPHGVTATCQGLVRTGWLSKSAVHELLEHRPVLGLEWLRALAREVREREDEIVLMASMDVPTRVARRLLLLAQRFGVPVDGGISIRHSLSRQEFADLAGTTKESASKALAAFVERGWIVTAPGQFDIHDVDALRIRCGTTAGIKGSHVVVSPDRHRPAARVHAPTG